MFKFFKKNKNQDEGSDASTETPKVGMDVSGFQQRRPMENIDSSYVKVPEDKPAEAVAPRVVNLSGFNRLINFLLLMLVFALPLLFLPMSSEVREFNKQTLLFFTVVIMLWAWVIRILATRSVSWVKTSLDYILLSYL